MHSKSYHALIYNLLLWSAAVEVEGFTLHGRCRRQSAMVHSGPPDRFFHPGVVVHAISNNDASDDESPTSDEPQQVNPISSLPVNDDQPTNPYPIDVPSPVLLSASMVLAIASTGSLFELMGGSPAFGLPVTAAIAVVGLPSCLFLFNASVLKAKAETEEDDAVFLGKKK